MRVGVTALTLAGCLTISGLACADDAPSGNWFTHLFTRSAAKDADKDEEKDAPPRTSPRNLLRKLKADLDRRQEVCMRLRDVAQKLDDEDLMQKAEQLDQRAWEIYLAGMNRVGGPDRDSETSAKKAGKKSKGDRE